MSQQHSSQQQHLQDILRWDTDQCKQQLQPALDFLLDALRDEPGNHDVLGVLCSKMMLATPQEELEEKLLQHLTPQLQQHFDVCLQQLSIEDATQDVIISVLQECEVVLSCIEQCLTSLQQSLPCHLSHIHSLPSLVLHVLEGSVTFCKESEQIYAAALFASLSQQLSSLFSRTTRLYKLFLELLLQMVIDAGSSLPEVLTGVHQVCLQVASLDMKLSVTSLKVIARLSSEHSALLQDDDCIAGIISALCTDTTDTMHYISTTKSSDGAGSSSSGAHVKVAGFKMKVIGSLVDTFPQKAPSLPLIRMMLAYYRCMEQDDYAASVHKLLTILVSKQHFSRELLKHNSDLSQSPRAGLQLLLAVTSSVCAAGQNEDDAVLDMWMCQSDNTHTLLYAVLLMIQKGGQWMVSTNSNSDAAAYERCCSLLCALAARVSHQHFAHVEECLLDMVLGSACVASLLASDIWAFLARYSTVDVCLEQCIALCHLLRSTSPAPVPSLSRMLSLLHRLAKFLPPDKQEELLDMFPLSDHHTILWSVLPLSEQHVASVTAQCKQQLQTITRQGYLCPADNMQLSLLLPVCQPDGSMVGLTMEMLRGSMLPSSLSSALITMLASCSSITPQQHQKIVCVSCDDPAVSVAMLRYLRAQIQQPSSPAVSDVLSSLLLSSVPVISLDARAVFADYASLTQHEATIQQCVHSNTAVHDTVVTYFNQLAGTETVEDVKEEEEEGSEEEEDKENSLDYSPLPINWYNAKDKKSSSVSRSEPASVPVSTEVLDAVLDLQRGVTALHKLPALPQQTKTVIQGLSDTLKGLVDKNS